MRAVLLSVPPGMLEERRRLGIDGQDEMWDGVVHVVPPAGDAQQALQPELLYALFPLARRAGLLQRVETGLYGDERDYRVPDQLYCRPEHRSDRGVEGAELVIEIRSAGDETYEKIDWYADRDVQEMLIVHPDGRRVELLRNVGGRLLPVSAGSDGALHSGVLGITLTTVDDRLMITWDGGSAQI